MATQWYQIKRGDTLTKIAKNFKVPLKFIQQRNTIIKDPNKIQAGWVLRIPDFSEMKAMASPLTDKGKPGALKPKVLKQYIPNNKYVPKPKTSVSSVLQLRASQLANRQTKTGAILTDRVIAAKPKPIVPVNNKSKQPLPPVKPYQPIVPVDYTKLRDDTKAKLFDEEKAQAISEGNFISVSDIEKSQRVENPLIIFEQGPSWIKKVFDTIAIKTKAFVKGETTETTALKKEMLNNYNLSDTAKILLGSMDIKAIEDNPLSFLLYGETAEITAGKNWWIEKEMGTTGTSKEEAEKKWNDEKPRISLGGLFTEDTVDPNLYARIPDRIKNTIDFKKNTQGKIEIMGGSSNHLMHELLHSNFATTILHRFGNKGWKTFEQSWAKARIDYPWETWIVDDFINKYYKDIQPHSLQSERYAYFGALFGKNGLSKLPPALKPYYGDIFK